MLKSIFSICDCFFNIFYMKSGSIPLHEVYYMKDMASFKKWFYDQVRLVNTACHCSPPAELQWLFSNTDATGKSHNEETV